MTYLRFPPPSGPILLPAQSRAAALAGIAAWSACRPLPRALRAGTWWLVKGLGIRSFPFRREDWTPPVTPDEWRELMAMWVDAVGPIEAFSVYEPAQRDRNSLALLAVGTNGPAGFIKMRPRAKTSIEEEALLAAWGSQSATTPRVVAGGDLGEWSYLVVSPFSSRLHRPPKPDRVERVANDVSHALQSLSRPASTPRGWEPMHGDFAPWNLREQRGVGLILFDFEHAGWAPRSADLVFYAAASSALGMAAPRLTGRDVTQAVRYWSSRLPARMRNSGRDQRLLRGMTEYLSTLSIGESR